MTSDAFCLSTIFGEKKNNMIEIFDATSDVENQRDTKTFSNITKKLDDRLYD